jgi:hypothetical protein
MHKQAGPQVYRQATKWPKLPTDMMTKQQIDPLTHW